MCWHSFVVPVSVYQRPERGRRTSVTFELQLISSEGTLKMHGFGWVSHTHYISNGERRHLFHEKFTKLV